MSYSSSQTYNDILANTKDKLRKDPNSDSRVSFEYMPGVRDRLRSFLRRMESGGLGFEEY